MAQQGYSGMDLGLANTQAVTLNNHIHTDLQNVITALSHDVDDITNNWQGTDASGFRDEWQSHLLPTLNQVMQVLDQFHTTFTTNITEQSNTSAS